MSSTALAKIEPLASEIEPSEPREENVFRADYYEILRIGPQADQDTIERIYQTLADRFHPDNTSTGDPETYLRLKEAYEILSNQARRTEYNVMRRGPGSLTRFQLRGREFFNGVRGGQNRRLAVLCLLYRQRVSTFEWPGLTLLDLEQLTGCTREELTAALWYLEEKQWAGLGEFTAYSITADGFDFVERELEDRLEFRTLATWSYYDLPAELSAEARDASGMNGLLPLDIEPAVTSDADVPSADHYEILGIRPQADEETIERVYRTLADRFHPDNPGTGDPKAFLRVREAYETLSDQASRIQYDAVRTHTRYPERFRLRGREFFEGIRGEQLRRLAVLCLLYRQAAGELPGLTVLDMEQLTGCTREELGSPLWYLRQKKWVRYGEFTEYSITAAGFDVVENKLHESQAVRPREWLTPEARRVNEVTAQEEVEAHVIQGPVEIEKASCKSDEDMHEQDAPDAWSWHSPDESYGNEFVYPYMASAADTGGSHEVPQSLAALSGVVSARDQHQGGWRGVSAMNDSSSAVAEPIAERAGGVAAKRVIFSMGGKGGVGKTSVMTGLSEWFEENRIPVALLDLDTENKMCGSLTHFFGGRVPKINIHTPAGLDAFVDILAEDAPAILADMGAGAGQITHDWFHKMYPDVTAAGVVFTAVGVVTSDPASVESVLNWAEALEDRVAYIIIENNLTEHTDFTCWQENAQAEEFRKRYRPAIIRLDYRLADLEKAARNHGATLGRVARRSVAAPELQRASLVMRAQSARRRMFEEFDKVKDLLLP